MIKIPKNHPVIRDFNFTVNKNEPYGVTEKRVKELGVEFKLIDLYEDESKKVFTIRFSFEDIKQADKIKEWLN